MRTTTYRAEFFTAADYARRNFEAGSPQEALHLARCFYDDNLIDLDFRSYDDNAGLDEIEVWDTAGGARATWQSDDYRVRKAAPQLLAALNLILPHYAAFLTGAETDLKECEHYQTARAALAKAAPAAARLQAARLSADEPHSRSQPGKSERKARNG
jgi:hypothetical protein